MKWTVTVLSFVMAAFYLFAGTTKLAGLAMHVEHFTHWGYPIWFMYVTGLVETSAAVLLLIPKTRFYGAVLIGCTMLGAVVTHLRVGEMARLPVPIVMLALAAFVATRRRPGAAAKA